MKVYGPYKSKQDGRSRVVIVHDNGQKQTKSWPRYILEEYIGNTLEDYEDVHHIDGNIDNNDISNLEVVYKSDHVRKHSTKYLTTKQVNCYYCGLEFNLNPIQQRNRFSSGNRGRAGPFCSRACSGKYGVEVQRST